MRAGRVMRQLRGGVFAIALATFLGIAATAHATVITNWSNPQPSGVAGANVLLIVSGSGLYDGSPMLASTSKLYIDGALVPQGSYTATSRGINGAYFFYNPKPPFTDGTHTFRVEMSDSVGRVSSRQWSAMIAQPPAATWITPAANAVRYDGRPTISLVLSDNTPGTTFSLAGQVRSGSSTGPVVATFGGAGLAAGLNSFALQDELAPGTYYLTASVTDLAGNTLTLAGTTARKFTLVAAPAMSVLPNTCIDAGCHSVADRHPATGMACSSCHVYVYHENGDCAECHGGHLGPITVTGVFGSCETCHSSAYPSVPRHTAANVDPAHASSCDGCHATSLLSTHAKTPAGSAYAYQCAVCHASSNSRVTAAVVAGTAGCDACHDADHTALHDLTDAPFCVDCHTGTNLVGIHTGPCASCHESADSAVSSAISAGTKECAACHSDADHESFHATTPPAGCAGCHGGSSLTTIHDAVGCSACHESSDPTVVGAIASGDKACSTCHNIQLHAGLSGTHTGVMTNGPARVFNQHEGMGAIVWDVPCSLCHGTTELLPIHGNDCALCHNGARPADSFATWNKSCQQGACHPTIVHPSADAAHNSYDCEVACHETNWDVLYSSCDACHNAVPTQSPYTTSNVQSAYVGAATINFSSPGSTTQYYRLNGGARVTGSTVFVPGPTSGTALHTIEYWSVNAGGKEELPHRFATFSITADTTPPTTISNAVSSYIGPATITLSVSDNSSSPLQGTYWRLNGGSQNSGKTVAIPQPASGSQAYTLEFWSVDASGNEELPHKTAAFTITADNLPPVTSTTAPAYDRSTGRFTVTFIPTDPAPATGVAATYYRVNGAAQVQSTTWNVYTQGVYTVRYWSVDKVGNTEAEKVHVLVKDYTAPATSTNAQASYTGSASIQLTPYDLHAGTDQTYYKLDDLPQTTGTNVLVTVNGTHTLKYWSVDKAGNVEAQKTVTFTLTGGIPDTVAPVTTSNAAATYTGAGAITLTPNDGAGSGVASTRYRFDGGAEQVGTSIAVPAPVAGPVDHTLTFWSVDNAGNVETPTTVTFRSYPATTATLAFVWHPLEWSQAHLRVTNDVGAVVIDRWVSGWDYDLDLSVTVPSFRDYYMECLYYYDGTTGHTGGPYGVWSSSTSINPDGVLSGGEKVTWYY